MKIVFLSDTHGRHKGVKVPDGDLLIHAGDLSNKGLPNELQDFFSWFSGLPHPHKVLTSGNHDYLAEKNPIAFKELIPDNCVYLEDSGATVAGIKIWGSPITPWFYDWAFNRQRGPDIARHWELIPEGTELLITHGPPFGILDRTARGKLAGCEDLLNRISIVQPKIHVFGHIHEAYGQLKQGNTHFINASILNLQYQIAHAPVVVDW